MPPLTSTPPSFCPSFHSCISKQSSNIAKEESFTRENMKGKFVKTCMNRWRKMGSKVIPCAGCEYCCKEWGLWAESKSIPKDVPKGHLVVYVGEEYKRFVIKITLLEHPLFKALLERAKDEYDFTFADSKLCIPCDEKMFLDVLRCADHGRSSLCL